MIVGLDIGTSFIRVAIGEQLENGKIEIVGIAKHKSAGLRNGVIVNMEDAMNAIKETIEMAEHEAGMEVISCVTGIGGMQIESNNLRGGVAVTTPPRQQLNEVTQYHIDQAIENAKAIQISLDREPLHVIKQNFIVDGVGGIKNPLHMQAAKLEAEVHFVTASTTTIENIYACINRAGYEVEGVLLKTLVAAQAVVHTDEMEVGSILIDMGAGTTDVMVLLRGAPVCSFSFPMGGNLITNDLVIVKGIPTDVAEKIKIESGCCWMPEYGEDQEVIIPGVGGRPPEETTQSALCEIIQPRVEEIFRRIAATIAARTNLSLLSGNIILTGGGAQMQGVLELATKVFCTDSVRIGRPEKLVGFEKYKLPEYATLIGLVTASSDFLREKNSKKTKKVHNAGSSVEKKENALVRMLKSFF